MTDVKLKPTITRSYGGQELELPRCQALNTTDTGAGKQCSNQVKEGEMYCHAHKPKAVFTTVKPDLFMMDQAEVCMQFNDGEPTVIFDGGPEATGPFTIEIRPPFIEGLSEVSFSDGEGNVFRIFVRKRHTK